MICTCILLQFVLEGSLQRLKSHIGSMIRHNATITQIMLQQAVSGNSKNASKKLSFCTTTSPSLNTRDRAFLNVLASSISEHSLNSRMVGFERGEKKVSEVLVTWIGSQFGVISVTDVHNYHTDKAKGCML